MYQFVPMSQKQAEEIAYQWHYDGIYSFYDMTADPDDLVEFLDPKQRENTYFAVLKESELIGFFSFMRVDEQMIEIGLGLKPELTDKGYGHEFIKAGIYFCKLQFQPLFITLSVATFNQRAIKAYKKIGFTESHTFLNETNGGSYEFVKMIYRC